ncbi:hypothetical protein [Vibrio neonatus]|uniref:hypothetical protein n=1 Tax=Vibrio neonatus TaxID=278860 RepID=UPI0021C46219|nr:hypothetical protein [Vibrio neonatus]
MRICSWFVIALTVSILFTGCSSEQAKLIHSKSEVSKKLTVAPIVKPNSATNSKHNSITSAKKILTKQSTHKVAKTVPHEPNKKSHKRPKAADKAIAKNTPVQKHIAPPLPEKMPPIMAPKKIGHPLANSTKIIFMLGQDKKGYYLYGEGKITEGTYDKFLRYVAYYKGKGIALNRLMIHSPGGLMNEAIKIGTYMQENKWGSASDQYMKCYSACGIIYASGVFKQIEPGAEIGFHRPYNPSKPDTERFKKHVYKVYKPYWEYIGGSSKLYDEFMHNYDRNQMLILTESNINKYMKVEKM